MWNYKNYCSEEEKYNNFWISKDALGQTHIYTIHKCNTLTLAALSYNCILKMGAWCYAKMIIIAW